MTQADIKRDLEQLGEIYPGIVLNVSIGSNYWNGSVDHIHFIVDVVEKTSIYDKRGYIISRFRSTSKKLSDMTSAKVASIHKTFIKKCIKLGKDYDALQSFIDTEIKFKYTKVNIYSRTIVFNIEDPDVQDLIIYVAYTINNKSEIVIIDNQGTSVVNAGTLFIKMQKELSKRKELIIEK